MENLNQFEGKKRAAGEELVYNEIIGRDKPKGEGKKGNNKKGRQKNNRDKKSNPNQIQNNNENNNEVEKEDTKKFNRDDTAKSFSTYRDLKSEKFEFYYRVKINYFNSMIYSLESTCTLFRRRNTISIFRRKIERKVALHF